MGNLFLAEYSAIRWGCVAARLFAKVHWGHLPALIIRWEPFACHSLPHLLQTHHNTCLVPAIILFAGTSFLSEYSIARSGCVAARLRVGVASFFHNGICWHFLHLPMPCARTWPVACHSFPHILQTHQIFLWVLASTCTTGTLLRHEYSIARCGWVTTILLVRVAL